MKVLLVFIDGIGIGKKDDSNPFFVVKNEVFSPISVEGISELPFDGLAKAIDAVLGVPGIPQSATGQTSILCGVNAQKIVGEHVNGLPTPALKNIIFAGNLLKWFKEAGLKTAFANAYRDAFFDPKKEKRRESVSTSAVISAGLDFMRIKDIIEGKALYQEFTNLMLIRMGYEIPIFSPEKAAQQLASIARNYNFCFYEYFLTDIAGHSQNLDFARKEVEKLDKFLLHLIKALQDEEQAIVVASDHGNLEDLSVNSHTCNPVPFMIWAKDKDKIMDEVASIADIANVILKMGGLDGEVIISAIRRKFQGEEMEEKWG